MTSFPGKFCSPEIKLDDLPKGGFLRRTAPDGFVVWFFRLPDGRRSKGVPDSRVPTVKGMPQITFGPWTLCDNVWRRH
jgi:hypothetical protein